MSGLRFLIISVALHSLIWWGLKSWGAAALALKNQPVQIEVVDHRNHEKQFTHSQRNKNLADLMPKNSLFEADSNQMVKEETRAKNLGYLSPVPRGLRMISKADPRTSETEKEKMESEVLNRRIMDSPPQLLSEMAPSDVTPLDHIKEGVVTSLNTEKNIYYSYFSRVDKQVVNQWFKNLRDFELRVTEDHIKKLAGQDWITLVEVVLDKEGHYKNFILHQGSGDEQLDLAAIQAFSIDGYFPNPPTGLVKDDGTIRLFYGFTVRVPPASRLARESQ